MTDEKYRELFTALALRGSITAGTVLIFTNLAGPLVRGGLSIII